jgi:hypothetical protein
MSDSDDQELLEANEAVKYLAEKWGISSYSLVAFRSLRFRYNIKPALSSKTSSFWRKSDLDRIPKPDRSKPRGKRKSKEDGDEESRSSSVVLMHTSLSEMPATALAKAC